MGILLVISLSIGYYLNKCYKIRDIIFEHIRHKFPKEYKELRIHVATNNRYPMFTSILVRRINKDSEYLPHDSFLDYMYKEFKNKYKIFTVVASVTIVIFFIFLIIIKIFLKLI